MYREPSTPRRLIKRLLGTALVILGLESRVEAADLRIGIDVSPTTIDPHFHNFGPDKSLAANVFETLVGRDEKQRVVPALALSWQAIDPTTWEFKLRPGVRFSDGTPFTSDDAAFTISRARTIPSSAFSSFALYTKPLTAIETPDPLTLRLRTATPFPLVPIYLSMISIVSRHKGAGASTADYDEGRAAIGTGPYRFVDWQRGSVVNLVRNESYWGERPLWDHVRFQVMPNAASRLAALLAGDVDAIGNVATTDVHRLEGDPRVVVTRGISPLVITFFPDQLDHIPTFALDNEGHRLPANPFRDIRVRKAVSLAIDRAALVDRVMDGVSSATAQFMPQGFYSHVPDIGVPRADPAAARALLAQAGYPNGFQLTLQCANDRVVNAEKICLAISQMLTRIGIRTALDTMPQSVFIPPAQRHEYSLFMHGMSTETGEVSSMLILSLASENAARGRGAINRGSYANPAFDSLLDQALGTLDDGAREAVLMRATRLLVEDQAIIPVLHQVNTWATKAGLVYMPHGDEFTVAVRVVPHP